MVWDTEIYDILRICWISLDFFKIHSEFAGTWGGPIFKDFVIEFSKPHEGRWSMS